MRKKKLDLRGDADVLLERLHVNISISLTTRITIFVLTLALVLITQRRDFCAHLLKSNPDENLASTHIVATLNLATTAGARDSPRHFLRRCAYPSAV